MSLTPKATLIAIVACLSYLTVVGYVLVHLWKFDGFGIRQKLWQSLLCITVPIFGPLLIFLFIKTDGTSRPKDSFEDEGPNV
jgi:hypothetical protein